MTKWIWKLLTEQNTEYLWFSLIRAKYVGVDAIFNSTPIGGSQFWRVACTKSNILLNLVLTIAYNVVAIRFWTDWWLGEAPIWDRYPRLYKISPNPEFSVPHDFTRFHLTLSSLCPNPFWITVGCYASGVPLGIMNKPCGSN
jgi:hypothetical protein